MCSQEGYQWLSRSHFAMTLQQPFRIFTKADKLTPPEPVKHHARLIYTGNQTIITTSTKTMESPSRHFLSPSSFQLRAYHISSRM